MTTHLLFGYPWPLRSSYLIGPQRGVGGGVDYLLYMKLFPVTVWGLVLASVLTFAAGFLFIGMSGTNRFHKHSGMPHKKDTILGSKMDLSTIN